MYRVYDQTMTFKIFDFLNFRSKTIVDCFSASFFQKNLNLIAFLIVYDKDVQFGKTVFLVSSKAWCVSEHRQRLSWVLERNVQNLL